MQPADNFSFEFQGLSLTAKKIPMQGRLVYHIQFPDRPALVIARATDFYASKFWTSIPEGRQPEAEAVGSAVQDYLSKLNQ
jgi:hypothetical protein